MKNTKIVFLHNLIFFSLICTGLSTISMGTDLHTFDLALEKHVVNKKEISFFTTTMNFADNKQLKVLPDLASNSFITGLASKIGWGLACTLGGASCRITNPTERTDVYNGFEFEFETGKTNTFFSKAKPSKISSPGSLETELIMNLVDPWPFAKSSIAGLGPNSSLINYYFSQYNFEENELLFALYLQLKDPSERFNVDDEIFEEASLTINGYDESKVFSLKKISWSESKGVNHWSLNNAQTWIDPINVYKGGSCLLWNSNSMILTHNPSFLLKTVNQYICKRDDCEGVPGSVVSGPTLKVSYVDMDGNTQKVTIQPKHYIYKEDGKFKIMVDDITKYQGKGCSKYAQVGLGRLFLLERYLVLKKTK